MARDWSELFILDGGGPPRPPEPEPEERRTGRFRRLRENLRKTRQALTSEIRSTLFEDLSEETWERLEEALIYADVGAATTARVVEQLEREATDGALSGGEALTERLVELLAAIARTGDDRIDIRARPTVILVAGVNGTGKTTTIGKLAWHLRTELDGLPLRDVRNLAEAQVHVAVAGEPEKVSPEIGKLSGSRGREQGDL